MPALLWVTALALITLALLPYRLTAARSGPIAGAWEHARQAGAYQFSGTLLQVTTPVASAANIGRSSRTDQIHLQGRTDTGAERMELTLWAHGGSLIDSTGALSVKVDDGHTWVRQGEGEWQESAGMVDGIAPQGDVMAYLAAVRDVRAGSPESRAGLAFTRYSFELDGPTFAAFVRGRLEEAIRLRGELPAGAQLEVPSYYRDMVGDGELWVGQDGLPIRQVLNLEFPAQHDERVSAQITLDFSNYARPEGLAALLANIGSIGALTGTLATLAAAFGLAAALVAFRRSRRLERALAVTMIVALVAGPLLSSIKTRALLDASVARATEQEQDRTAAMVAREASLSAREGFDANVSPLALAESMALQGSAVAGAAVQAPTLQADPGTDTDGDGLTDFAEARVGTDPSFNDSDEDGIGDSAEVRGFSFNGQSWFSDPLAIDSNGDGMADTVEYDADGNGTPDDTDGDKIPDLFDNDNDNDGVPDRLDQAPFTRSPANAPFGESAPLKLTLRNLEASKPIFVDFQLRPTNPEHLWYALNPLDWPDDQAGQIRDLDRSSGELQLLPMLEIRTGGDSANLPSQADLLPFNINTTTLVDGAKVAYVPLTLATDEATGERVAFNGRMRYQASGSWPTPHEVRFIWVVQVKTDVPCEVGSDGCSADGYRYNLAQTTHSYYDSWSLTGLTVQEDHGSKTAIIYEDPAADTNPSDDTPLLTLAAGLNSAFIGGRDQNSDSARDVTIEEIARRFDRATNSAVSATERWEVPNILRVERGGYTTVHEAVASTTMTETKRILTSAFDGPWSANNTLKPMLLFADETSFRTLGLDASRTSGGFFSLSGGDAVVDMQPSGQSKIALNVMASFKALPYCRATGGAWDACDSEAYFDELERRYGTEIGLPGQPESSDVKAGRAALVAILIEALRNGASQVVQQGPALISSRYRLLTDSETVGLARTVANGGAAAVAAIADTVIMARYVDKIGVLEYLGRTFKELRGGTVGQLGLSAIDKLRNFGQNRLAGVGIILGAAVLIGAVGTLAATIVGKFGDQASKITIKVLVISISLFLGVISPLLTVKDWAGAVKAAGSSVSILRSGVGVLGTSAKAGLIGAVVTIAITWGFFIYSMVSNKVSAFSPTFNKALAETIAATLYLLFVALLSATVVGLIIVGIIGFIDAVLLAVCELGIDVLRTVPGLGGACFTLGTAAIKGIAFLIYGSQEMIDLGRNDLVVTGVPDLNLINPNLGYTAGSAFSLTMPVTSTILHKNPDPSNGLHINFYLWLYSQDNLRSSTLRYTLSRPGSAANAVSLSQMSSEWQGVRERNAAEGGKYVLTPMYRGQAAQSLTLSSTLPATPGLNKPVDFYLNMGYAVPSYECIGIPTSICWTREIVDEQSLNIDVLTYDIFPATISGFTARTARPDGGRGLAWDQGFASMPDSDGDGLISGFANGPDPDDTTWDTDGDGVSDARELERQQTGFNLSPRFWDTDNDGLTDAQELQLSTNPARADSDGDGLSDGQEVRHLVYSFNQTAKRVETNGTLAGGVEVQINAASPFSVHVSSDPLRADGDGDGLSDAAEYALATNATPALRLDSQNQPYHPNVVNAPPLSVAIRTNDADGFLAPGQSLVYTSTVVTRAPLAPGVLDVTTPASFAATPPPALLGFDSATFTTAQTVTQQANLSVLSTAATGNAALSSAVRSRLAATGPSGWQWEPIASQAALSRLKGAQQVADGVSVTQLVRYTEAVAKEAGREDSFQITSLTWNDSGAQVPFFGPPMPEFKDVAAYALPGGTTVAADDDLDALDSNLPQANLYLPSRPDFKAARGPGAPNLACNSDGVCMVVWDQVAACGTLTINSLTLTATDGESGTEGIEPIIYLVRNGYDGNPINGGYQLLWDSQNNGGNQMTTGQTRGPNANGFPITRQFCGNASIALYELDGTASYDLNPTSTQWDQMQFLGRSSYLGSNPSRTDNITFGAGIPGASNDRVTLNISFSSAQRRVVVGSLIGADGTVIKPEFPLATAITDPGFEYYRPVVASDGTNFMTAWMYPLTRQSGLAFQIENRLMRRPFNAAGAPLANDEFLGSEDPEVMNRALDTVDQITLSRPGSELGLTWIGDRYRLTRLLQPGPEFTAVFRGATPVTQPEITARDLDASGARIGFGTTVLASDAARDDGTVTAARTVLNGHELAYDLATGNTLLIYQAGDGSVKLRLFSGGGSVLQERVLAGAGTNPQVAYHAPSGGWIVGWEDASGSVKALALKADSTDLVEATPQTLFTSTARSSALACPAAAAKPVVDLRFEELPGPTGFANTGNSVAGTCSGANCPLAGYAGATDSSGAVGTPPSDYAARFDGQGDSLSVAASAANSFSVAFWLKTAPGALTMPVVSQGGLAAGAWSVRLVNGRPALSIGSQTLNTNIAVNDGAWHHVVATRAGATGQITLYVDGAQAASTTGPGGMLTAASSIQVGGRLTADTPFLDGLLDEVKVLPVALGASAAQALYASEQQSYCVGTGVTTARDGVQLARLSLRQLDPRGGALTTASTLNVTIDADRPSSSIAGLTNNERIKGNQTLIIGGAANDSTSGVAKVEVRINDGPWQTATGAESWSFALPVTDGSYNIQTRATDAVGNVEQPAAAMVIVADGTAPGVTLNPLAPIIKPGKDADGRWTIALGGAASDSGGVATVEARMLGSRGEIQDHGWQVATHNGGAWSLTYTLDLRLSDPNADYTIQVRATDGVGNASGDMAATGSVSLDGNGPVVSLSATDTSRRVITSTITLTGLMTDTASLAGLKGLEIAFTPIEQFGALLDGATTAEAEAQLSRAWYPVTAASFGAGVSTSAWSFQVPAGLEGEYQIDMRATDQLDNSLISAGLWRGVIDNTAPRILLNQNPNGASYVDTQAGTERFGVDYTCAAEDRYLSGEAFSCPRTSRVAERTYLQNAVLQRLFPDRTLLKTLGLGYTLWEQSATPAAQMRACDSFGNCATASVGMGNPPAPLSARLVRSLDLMGEPQLTAAPAPGAPRAVVVSPQSGGYVTASSAVPVTVAAEAGQSLREVRIRLDGQVVQTLSFNELDAVKRTVQTVQVPVAAEGAHTLVAEVSDWAGGVQSTTYPVTWALDRQDPALTITTSSLEPDDTWLQGSGMLRFVGTASDFNGLAAVQLRVGDQPFADATVEGSGAWRTAYRVVDPEGSDLLVTVRAIDRSGRVTTLTRTIPTALSAPDAPNTVLGTGPANPSGENSATFTFTGMEGGRSIAGYECRLDQGAFEPCASPYSYSDLSKGAHIFAVRAVDSQGNVDLTPATYSWTVLAGQPDAVIGTAPAATTSSRAASFSFSGAGAARFECSLDGATYQPCTSPTAYTGLVDGAHVFLVRGVDGGGKAGPADRLTWTVVNSLPVASNGTFFARADLTVPIVLPASDANGDALSYRVVDLPTKGVLTGVAPNLVYLPNTGSYKEDSFTFRAADAAGESNTATVTIIIDNVAPVTTATSTVTANGVRGTVTLTATDNLTGVASTSYSINGGPVQTYGDTINLAGLGVYNVSYFSTDVAGNKEQAMTITVTLTPSCTPLGAAANYNVFALGDLVTTNLSIIGGVAAGRDASLSRLRITGDVVVGRNASGGGGTINGRLIVGGTDSTNLSTLTVRGGRQQATPINFAAEGADLILVSDSYAAMTANGTVTTQSGALRLTGTSATRNVFSVTSQQLARATSIAISVPARSLVVINISGTSLTMGGYGIRLSGTTASKVLWNAPEATTASVSRVSLPGTLLIPRAALSFSGGTITGAIIPGSYKGSSSGTSATFLPCN